MRRAFRWLCETAPRYAAEIGVLSMILAVLWLVVAFWPAAPLPAGGLTKRQAWHTSARRDAALAAVALDTARAYRATTSARRAYAAGRRAQSHAIRLHTQSHAPVRPAADSTATRLQRLLAAY